MENIVQHASIRGRSPRRGPVIAGLAVALPLGVGAGAAAPHSVPAHQVAPAVHTQPAGAGHIQTTVPVVTNHVAPRLVVANHVAPRLASHLRVAIPADGGAPGGACNGSLFTATLRPFSEYMNHAHLERSPLQQASDVQDVDTYIKTHMALMQNMSQPVRNALFATSDGSTSAFLGNMYHDHFERSPFQQAQDMSQFDSYVKQHTILVEHMLQPVLTAVNGNC
jgi:hypothetical protein